MTGSDSLVEILHLLRLRSYSFTTVTPKTHATVLARPCRRRPDLRDIVGWNRPFVEADLDPLLLTAFQRADAIAAEDGKLRSRIRVASLGADLFLHSGFPTHEPNAVFFGPDTYRFARFIGQHAETVSRARVIVDMGAGSGAGGVAAARLAPEAQLVLVDVNEQALQFAAVNATAAGLNPILMESDRVPDEFDLLIANPPYLMDAYERTYRHGGDLLGGAVSLDWVSQGLEKLRPGSTILLYTGAAYVRDRSPLIDAISELCRASGFSFNIDEIDPDVFGEELSSSTYAETERIAAVGLTMHHSSE